ncbi:uncharacterized protein TNCV_3833351 [Trichonephila clavipes]|nr:uncharacterized protein TNCV_3833351 [Trichonephila clavipes]
MYGAAQGNGAAAERMYRERFPRRKHPDRRTFERIHRELRTSGTFYASRHGTGIGRYRRTPSLEQRILNTVDNPSTSSRAVGRALGVSHQSVLRTLHEDRMHPYHLQRVQAITPDDYPRRLNFATWYLQQTAENKTFPADVLFTDEATFTRSEVVPELLVDVPPPVRSRMWFPHDGAPANFSRNVRNHLDTVYGQHWIGRGGPVPWPPRSPDLSCLDFFLLGPH